MNRNKRAGAKEIFNYQTTFDYWTYKMTADVKSINIKIRAYYFLNDMINVGDFDLNVLKIGKKSHKNQIWHRWSFAIK